MNITKRIQFLKAIARSVLSTTRNLTQPTGLGGELGWHRFYHTPVPYALGGIHQGLFDSVEPDCGSESSNVGGTMITHPTFIPRTKIIDVLTKLRQEWEQAAEGENLVELDGSVGLLLADLAIAIGLTPEEQVQALGADLVNELQGMLVSAPEGNGNH
jgi:hypothetical protein